MASGQFLAWQGTTDQCTETALVSLSHIKYYYGVTQSGGSVLMGSPELASLNMGDFQNIECGLGSYVHYTSPVSLLGYVKSDLGNDMGRLSLLFEELITISNLTGEFDPANGEFKLTTYFTNNKPTYRNENGWWIWWNGVDWSLTDSIQNPTKTLKNNDTNPSGGKWDCEPSCQQAGRGPESPDPSCIPSGCTIISTEEDIPNSYWVEPQSMGDIPGLGNIVFGPTRGAFGFDPSEFSSDTGASRQYTITFSDSSLCLFVTATNWPESDAFNPTVYFKPLDSDSCYTGQLILMSGSEPSREATLSLV